MSIGKILLTLCVLTAGCLENRDGAVAALAGAPAPNRDGAVAALAAASWPPAGRSGKRHCVKRLAGHRTRARMCRARRPARHHARAPATAVTPPSSPTTLAGGSPVPGAPTPPAPSPPAESPAAKPPAAEPPAVPHVQVTAFEYGLTLSRSSVAAGKVILEFVDGGQDEHNLNGVSAEGELAFSFHTALAKEVHEETMQIRHGSYVLFCSLPEHEAKGMKATLVVE
ncbi:MAG: hypothetical protein ACYDC2_09170 [Solirubrobacteraceae bacterium]